MSFGYERHSNSLQLPSNSLMCFTEGNNINNFSYDGVLNFIFLSTLLSSLPLINQTYANFLLFALDKISEI